MVYVGISEVHLIFRQSRSLKDKRQILSSLIQKLRNEGFSACETEMADDPKQGVVGFSYSGKDLKYVEEKQLSTRDIFLGDFQVGRFRHELVNFGLGDDPMELSWEEEEFK